MNTLETLETLEIGINEVFWTAAYGGGVFLFLAAPLFLAIVSILNMIAIHCERRSYLKRNR